MLNKIIDPLVLTVFKAPVIARLDGKKRTIGNVLTMFSAVLYGIAQIHPGAAIVSAIPWLDLLMVGLGIKTLGDAHANAKQREEESEDEDEGYEGVER